MRTSHSERVCLKFRAAKIGVVFISERNPRDQTLERDFDQKNEQSQAKNGERKMETKSETGRRLYSPKNTEIQ